MASKTVSPTANEQRLGNMFIAITTLAYSASSVLMLSDDATSPSEAAHLMLKVIGSIADLGIKYSNSGHAPMIGGVDVWLGLDKFALDTDVGAAHAN